MTVEIKVIGDTVESFLPSQLRKRIATRPEDFPNGQFNDQFRIPLECTRNGTRFFSLLPLSWISLAPSSRHLFPRNEISTGIRLANPRDIAILFFYPDK